MHQKICKKATQCALEVRKEIQKDKYFANIELSLGIGLGDFHVLHMGGVLKRIEFFVAGEALQRALSALRITNKVNPIVVSCEVWESI